MPNPGVAPLDSTTAVGQLRAILGDTSYVDLTPPIAGMGDYAVYSDADLVAALTLAKGSILRAAGQLTKRLALQYSAEGRSIKTDDLAIDVRSRGADLLKVAESFIDDADAEDEAELNDYFNIVAPFRAEGPLHPEGAQWPAFGTRLP